MVAYTKPKQRRKEGTERLRGEGDQIKFIDDPNAKVLQYPSIPRRIE